MTRAERRYRWECAKARAARLWLRWCFRSHTTGQPVAGTRYVDGVYSELSYSQNEFSAKIAHMAETHSRPCSCWMCSHREPKSPRGQGARGVK